MKKNNEYKNFQLVEIDNIIEIEQKIFELFFKMKKNIIYSQYDNLKNNTQLLLNIFNRELGNLQFIINNLENKLMEGNNE